MMKDTTNRAFSLIELLIVLAIAGLLLGLLAPVLSRGQAEAHAARCLANLKQLSSGFHLYADEHDGELPSVDVEDQWFVLLSQYLPDERLYECPADEDVVAMGAGISYAWRDSLAVMDPAASLAGRNLGASLAPDLILLFDNIPGWHGGTHVQASALDTSVRRYSHDDFQVNMGRRVDQ